MWPNSCSTTQAKMRTMKIVLSSAAPAPPRPQALNAIQASSRRKVIWILTSVPPKRPTVMDQSIVPPPDSASKSRLEDEGRAILAGCRPLADFSPLGSTAFLAGHAPSQRAAKEDDVNEQASRH